jgi:hypothetical protein
VIGVIFAEGDDVHLLRVFATDRTAWALPLA